MGDKGLQMPGPGWQCRGPWAEHNLSVFCYIVHFGVQCMLRGGKRVAGPVTALRAYCETRVGGKIAKRVLLVSHNEKIS